MLKEYSKTHIMKFFKDYFYVSLDKTRTTKWLETLGAHILDTF